MTCLCFFRVARLAVEVLRLAQQGDSQAVLDMVAPMHGSPTGRGDYGLDRMGRDMGKLSVKEQPKDIRFSSHISAVHQGRDGISIEQVPTGLRDGLTPEPQGRKDALRLCMSPSVILVGPFPFSVYEHSSVGVYVCVCVCISLGILLCAFCPYPDELFRVYVYWFGGDVQHCISLLLSVS